MWSGKRALEVGLVDALGGISRAVAIAKRELKIPDNENVSLIELSREMPSPLALLSGGGASALGPLLVGLYQVWTAFPCLLCRLVALNPGCWRLFTHSLHLGFG